MNSHNDAPRIHKPGAFIWLLLTTMLLAIVGLLITGYLTYQGFTQIRIAGCGAESSCNDVLSSRYATVMGIPVALLAVIVYMDVIGLTLLRLLSKLEHLLFHIIYACNALALISAAISYISIQAVILNAFCPWCMAAHVIGILTAISIFLTLLISHRQSIAMIMGPASVTLLPMAIVLLIQAFQTVHTQPAVIDIDTSTDQVTGENIDREIILLDGALTVQLSESMTLGNPEAKNVVALFFDYNCYNCRVTHGQLKVLLSERSDILVVLIPTPISHECNPRVYSYTPSWAETSCELTKLALAYNLIDPSKANEIDNYLFSEKKSPSPQKVKQFAINAHGADKYAEALSSPKIEQSIEKYTDAFYDLNQIMSVRLPVIMVPGAKPRMGAVDDANALNDALNEMFLESESGQ